MGCLGAVRKQLWSGPTSFAFEVPSVTPGHYNQLLNPDDFSDSSRTSELLMKKVLDCTKRPKICACRVLSKSAVCYRGGHGRKEVLIPSSQQAVPALCHHPFSSSSAAHCFDFMLPMSYPVARCLVYAGGNCVYIHI